MNIELTEDEYQQAVGSQQLRAKEIFLLFELYALCPMLFVPRVSETNGW